MLSSDGGCRTHIYGCRTHIYPRGDDRVCVFYTLSDGSGKCFPYFLEELVDGVCPLTISAEPDDVAVLIRQEDIEALDHKMHGEYVAEMTRYFPDYTDELVGEKALLEYLPKEKRIGDHPTGPDEQWQQSSMDQQWASLKQCRREIRPVFARPLRMGPFSDTTALREYAATMLKGLPMEIVDRRRVLMDLDVPFKDLPNCRSRAHVEEASQRIKEIARTRQDQIAIDQIYARAFERRRAWETEHPAPSGVSVPAEPKKRAPRQPPSKGKKRAASWRPVWESAKTEKKKRDDGFCALS